jgi:hypothetical protein
MKFVPQSGQKQPYRCCYPAGRASRTGGPGPGAPAGPGTARGIRVAVMAGDRLAGSSGGRHRGPHSCSPLCLTATGGRAAARILARVLAHGTVSGRRRTTAPRRLLPSSQRFSPDDLPRAARARPRPRATTSLSRRPESPGWRDGGGSDVPSYERTSRGRIGPATARGLAERGNKTALFHADLHIHSKFSRACSRDCDIPHLAAGALREGISVLATGDFTHPARRDELKGTLVPAEAGLLHLRPDLERDLRRRVPAACEQPVRFMLSVEISTIYRRDEHTRKVHHLIYAPTFAAADRITASASKIGNLASDGRPILGLDSRDLLEITLEVGPAATW